MNSDKGDFAKPIRVTREQYVRSPRQDPTGSTPPVSTLPSVISFEFPDYGGESAEIVYETDTDYKMARAIVESDLARWQLVIYNEGGYNGTTATLLHLLRFVRDEIPELWAAVSG